MAIKKLTKQQAKSLVTKELKSSGITPKNIEYLIKKKLVGAKSAEEMQEISHVEKLKLSTVNYPAIEYVFPAVEPTFSRYRRTEQEDAQEPKGFGRGRSKKLAEEQQKEFKEKYPDGKIPYGEKVNGVSYGKYWQPQKEADAAGTHLYLPQLPNIDTITSLDNKAKVRYFVEGEKKALAMAQLDFTVIGSSGVTCFMSSPEFDEIDFEETTNYILFDADIKNNPDVRLAAETLGDEIILRGGKVFIAYLPESADKLGIDDYLLTFKTKSQKAKAIASLESEEYESEHIFHKLNKEFCYIYQGNCYYNIPRNEFYKSAQAAANGIYARDPWRIPLDDERDQSVVTSWNKWSGRREATRITYEPDPRYELEGDLNIFKGFPTKPEKGDIKPFNDLINSYFRDADDEIRKWFVQWLAYPLQNPGTKMFTAALLIGGQGIGKSFIGEIMCRIYGDAVHSPDNINAGSVSADDLFKNFNAEMIGKVFVVADEIVSSSDRKQASAVKKLLTDTTLRVERKGFDAYKLRNCFNVLFTANHIDAVYLEEDDRRFFIHEAKHEAEPQSFYTKIDNWLNKENGAAHLMYHLQNEVDCSDFSPMAPALVTEAKKETRIAGMSETAQWCKFDLLESPNKVIPKQFHDCDLFEMAFLCERYNAFHERYPQTPKVFGNALSDAHKNIPKQASVYVSPGITVRLVAIRNFDFWKDQPKSEWQKHYREHFANKQTRRRSKAILSTQEREDKPEKSNVVNLDDHK